MSGVGRSSRAPLGPVLAASSRFAPPAVSDLVTRTRTAALLGGAAPATLVCAAAGWGKSLAVAQWCAGLPSSTRVAWVDLGEDTEDPAGFWSAVTRSLAESTPGVTRTGAGAAWVKVARAASAGPDRSAAALADVLATVPDAVVLVLDGLDRVADPEVHAALESLVRARIAGLTLVVTTRHDPPWALPRLRVDGLLVELRAEDLAFDASEAAALLAACDVALIADDVELLVERTDGWPAALRLAALRLARARDPHAFVAQFSGDEQTVADYLLAEVLVHRSAEDVELLTAASVTDEVCAGLAGALTGDGDAERRLRSLAASNLLVHALSASGEWYRLPTLVSDVLRHRIDDPARLRELHSRAATWYLEHELVADALRHALAARDWDGAARLLGEHVVELVVRGNPRDVEAAVAGSRYDAVVRHAELAAGLAAARVITGRVDGVEDLLAAGRSRLSELDGVRRERAELVLDVVQMAWHRIHGELELVAALAARVPQDYRAFDALGLRSWDALVTIAQGNLGTAMTWLDHPGAEGRLRAAIDLGRAASVAVPRLNAQAHLAMVLATRGALDEAEETARSTLAELVDVGWEHAGQAGAAYVARLSVGLVRDDAESVDEASRGLEQVLLNVPEPNLAAVHAILSARWTARLRRPAPAAELLIAQADRLVERPLVPALSDALTLTVASLLLRAGDLPGAAERIEALKVRDAPSAAAVQLRFALVGAGTVRLDEVARRAERLANRPELTDLRAVDLLVLAAVARQRADDESGALATLDAALLRAAPQRVRLPIAESLGELRGLLLSLVESGSVSAPFVLDVLAREDRLAGRGSATARGATSDGPPLTERELTIVRYLASALSNAEIAAELFVSVNTVKTHQRMIYRKLGVGGRREAVRRARELGII